MLAFTLRGLWARKRRLISSFLAVFLGTAFLAGTMVLGDTLQNSIGAFVSHVYAGTDVVVRNATSVTDRPGALRGMIDGTVAGKVAQVPGVAVAEPVIQNTGQLLKTDGTAVNVLGPRTAGNWISDPALNPYSVAQGRAPERSGEVIIDKKVAKDGGLQIGDRTVLLTPDRVPVTIVGLARFGTEDAFGGTSFTGMTLDDARRYLTDAPGRISSVSVKAAPGVSQTALAARIRPLLPQGVEAISGKKLTGEQLSSLDSFMNFVRTFLLTFALVALLVGVLGIHNTFAIVVAQRTRESALLRALGAARRQLLAGVVAEGLVIGTLAALAGAAGGVAFAAGLRALFVGFGLGLKGTSLSISVTPFLVSVPVGMAVTVVACLIPALRASRVPPVAALRESAAEPARMSPTRPVVGSAFAVVGGGLLLWAALAGSSALAAVGAVVALIAMVVLGPVAVRPVAALVGAPAARSGAGDLARRNAMRSPRRTAGAATALMVGIGVVTLFTVLAASLEQTTADNFGKSFSGDLVVNAGSDSSIGFAPSLAGRVAAMPQVARAAGMGSGDVLVDGRSKTVHVADPAGLAGVVRLRARAGSLDGLGADRIAVSTKVGRPVGAPVTVRYSDGTSRTFTVGAVYDPLDAVGDYLLPRAAWAAHDPKGYDMVIFVDLRSGVRPAAAKTAIEGAARAYGAPSVQTRAEYIDGQTSSLRSLLTVVYVMLALAILIALMGIANTLSLAVHERTRELGLLRAVGATRRQTRSIIRWESLIVALFGTVGGVGLGLVLGWVFVAGASDSFAAPPAQLAVIVIVGASAGVLAALRPARRAARLRIIDALATS